VAEDVAPDRGEGAERRRDRLGSHEIVVGNLVAERFRRSKGVANGSPRHVPAASFDEAVRA